MNLTSNTQNQAVQVILVEDDDGDAKAINRAFEKAKITNPIIRAIDGIEALKILRGEDNTTPIKKPYILLVDLNMPRMNGLTFIKELRNDKALKHSIVFVLTTSKKDEDKVSSYDLNVAGYIVKETAGHDFLKLVDLLNCYWRIVEMPA